MRFLKSKCQPRASSLCDYNSKMTIAFGSWCSSPSGQVAREQLPWSRQKNKNKKNCFCSYLINQNYSKTNWKPKTTTKKQNLTLEITWRTCRTNKAAVTPANVWCSLSKSKLTLEIRGGSKTKRNTLECTQTYLRFVIQEYTKPRLAIEARWAVFVLLVVRFNWLLPGSARNAVMMTGTD